LIRNTLIIFSGNYLITTAEKGFTLIELIVVIVILGVIAAIAAPKFGELRSSARIAVIENIAGTMKSTAQIIQAKAIVSGLSVTTSNPGNQAAYIVTTNIGSAEVDWRNLCPESRAELADQLTMIDYIDLTETAGLTSQLNNQYTLIGYDIPGFSVPTNSGCYVIYDSFGNPNCTATAVTVDC
jgi:MSHA pilin protein MshA